MKAKLSIRKHFPGLELNETWERWGEGPSVTLFSTGENKSTGTPNSGPTCENRNNATLTSAQIVWSPSSRGRVRPRRCRWRPRGPGGGGGRRGGSTRGPLPSGNMQWSDKRLFMTRKLNVSKQEIFRVTHWQCLIGLCLLVLCRLARTWWRVTLRISICCINWLSERKQSEQGTIIGLG